MTPRRPVSRWLTWTPPGGKKFDPTPEPKPSEPSEPGFEGFEGSTLGATPNFSPPPAPLPDPSLPGFLEAFNLVEQSGVRIVPWEGDLRFALWADTDSPALRAAMRLIGYTDPVVYLDDPRVPFEYKQRDDAAYHLPEHVILAMYANPDAAWEVRDRLLAEIDWQPQGQPWITWRARQTPFTPREGTHE